MRAEMAADEPGRASDENALALKRFRQWSLSGKRDVSLTSQKRFDNIIQYVKD
jgi:hypothetical protein